MLAGGADKLTVVAQVDAVGRDALAALAAVVGGHDGLVSAVDALASGAAAGFAGAAVDCWEGGRFVWLAREREGGIGGGCRLTTGFVHRCVDC